MLFLRPNAVKNVANALFCLLDCRDNGVEVRPVAGVEFGMEQFAIGANLESAAARGNQRKRLDAHTELKNAGRQTDGLRRVVSNDAIFDRDFGLDRQTPLRQRSYRCDERWSRNAQEWWRCARRALQRSRRLTQASLQLKKCSRSPLTRAAASPLQQTAET